MRCVVCCSGILAKQQQRKDTRFSGKEDKHEHGVGFLVHKDIVSITVVQEYALMSDYDDNEIEEFYDQLQNIIDQTPKKDILVVQGD